MKKVIFVLASFAVSFASAATSTQLSCNVVRLTDTTAYTVVAVSLNCATKNSIRVSTLEYGIVAFECEQAGDEINVSVHLPVKNVTWSSGRSLALAANSSFSSYYATVDDALMINCRN